MSTLRVLDKDGNWVDIPTIVGPVGPVGPTGETGPGVSSGGSAGQILRKKSGDDFDTEWVTPTDMDLYYTKEEADDLINSKISTTFKYKGTKANYAAIQAVTNPAVGDVWNDASTDHNYVWNGSAWDKLAGVVDMTNYYTKDEAEDMVDDKLAGVPINDLLHYKGHVDSIDELPDLGQPSGTTQITGTNARISNYQLNQLFNTDVSSGYSVSSLLSGQGYQYYLGMDKSVAKSTYNYGCVGVMTDYPECVSLSIRYVGYGTRNLYEVRIKVKYDPDKPVYYRCKATSTLEQTVILQYEESGSIKKQSITSQSVTTALIDKDMLLCSYQSRLFTAEQNSQGVVNDTLTFRIRTNIEKVKLDTGLALEPASSNVTMLYSEDGYIWNPGMNFLGSISGDGNNMTFYKNIPNAEPNDIYSIGTMRELYRCNNTASAWEKLSDFKEFSTTAMTEADYIELEDKSGFDLYVLDRVAEITDTTNLLINSITGDVDLVEANISEEEALAITDEIIGGVSDE